MLKKLIVLLFTCTVLLPLHANDLVTKVARAVAEQTVTAENPRPVLEWVKSLRLIQMQFRPVRLSYIPDDFPVSYDNYLSYKDEEIYLRRVLQIQKEVTANPELKAFSFVAPKAADLAKLTAERLTLLENFLKAPIEQGTPSDVVHTKRVRPFTLAVQLGKNKIPSLEIWIDVPTKKIYLMSDNFYSTAESKYSLHLF